MASVRPFFNSTTVLLDPLSLNHQRKICLLRLKERKWQQKLYVSLAIPWNLGPIVALHSFNSRIYCTFCKILKPETINPPKRLGETLKLIANNMLGVDIEFILES